MAGECRLHRDLRGFGVAHLADHDDVGILTHDGTQRRRKGQADLAIHLHLVDPEQLVFNRTVTLRDTWARISKAQKG